jgi:hypothetical protein
MIYLKDVSDWLKSFDLKFNYYYIGFLDSKKEKSLGIYNLKRESRPIIAIGGKENTSYNVKKISLLVHYTNETDTTEEIANELFEKIMDSNPNRIGDHDIHFIGMLSNEAIDVGRDANGICEYVIEFEIYYKK